MTRQAHLTHPILLKANSKGKFFDVSFTLLHSFQSRLLLSALLLTNVLFNFPTDKKQNIKKDIKVHTEKIEWKIMMLTMQLTKNFLMLAYDVMLSKYMNFTNDLFETNKFNLKQFSMEYLSRYIE